ncbi:MAG: trehalose-6-phosphate synthase [Citromicrobium sp.]|nr:MAG: trehalose-6-phosphate synthase [Citromicrobium sp.]
MSNRVAAPNARGAGGAQGGLAGALLGALKSRGGLWFGWSGETAEAPSDEPALSTEDGVTFATVDLSPAEVADYYEGYANSTLWPLFHYRLDLAQYERDTGIGYEAVNERFADCVSPLLRPDDVVWVHDYHLIPMGDGLRRRGFQNRIGFFLHIPWPPTRLLTSLPHHERLVRALLAYDVVGFQCDEWLDSFQHYCAKELGAIVDEDSGEILIDGHCTIARTFPIGIDFDHFTELGETEEARQTAQRILSSTRERTAMIGVDRLDYSKGLPERLDGISRFFERHPERVDDLVFIQIAPPSRTDIASYQQIRATLEQKTGQINGAYSRIDLVPVRYVNQGLSAAELFGAFRACKIGLVTPLRDGMNLVAKEYVAAQDPEDPGVLILSRFAGAAEQLRHALQVNPHSPDDIAQNIRIALEMPLEERKARWRPMFDCVREENLEMWTQSYLDVLASGRSL